LEIVESITIVKEDRRTPAPQYETKTLLKYVTKDGYRGWIIQIKEKK
jgi:hypothetical protein